MKRSSAYKIIYYAVWTLLVLLLLAMLFFVAQNRGLFETGMNSGKDSIYDLSDKELDSYVSLADGWKYYPEQFIISQPEEDQYYEGYVNLSTGKSDTGERIKKIRASFQKKLVNVPEEIALYISGDNDKFSIYINQNPVIFPERRMINHSVVSLAAGNDYDIVIESEGYLPMQGFSPMVISDSSLIKKLDSTQVILILTLGICIFSLASVLIVSFSIFDEERRYMICVFVMTLFSVIWYLCYTNKYLGTLNAIFPQMTDYGTVLLIDICMCMCLSLDMFLILPKILNPNLRRIADGICISVTVLMFLALAISRIIPELMIIKTAVVLISMGLLCFSLVLLMRKLLRNEISNYFQFYAFVMIPFAFGIAMMFNKDLIDLKYMYLVSGMIVAYDFLMIISIILRNYEISQMLSEAAKAQEKMIHLQGAFWASQIQPHFIYNTLLSIQSLCLTDPLKAMELTGKFSHHLRNSVDYINTTKLIPFSEEMLHVENYVEIQKVRFGTVLQYRQFFETENFMIPPLTLQPLVENAICHGIRGQKTGGTITVRTVETKKGIYITVTDDGPGFDVSSIKKNGGIENVRNRLIVYLHAELTYPEISRGTMAEIFIPAREVKRVEDDNS